MCPWGDDWEQAALISTYIANSAGSKVKFDEVIKGEGLKEEKKEPPTMDQVLSVLRSAEPR